MGSPAVLDKWNLVPGDPWQPAIEEALGQCGPHGLGVRGANPVVLRGHEGDVTAVAISPDNRWLVTGSADNTARLSLFQVNDLINLARVTVGRNFSAYEWRLYFPGEKHRKTQQ